MALTNNQYDTIRRDYDQRQFQVHRRMASHTEELYQKDPEIQEIDRKIASLSVQQAEKLLDGDKDALSNLRLALHELNERKDTLIRRLGYDPDFLEPVYHCPDCKDTGYINGQKCHCFTQAAIDLVYTQSNLRQVLEKENFSKFNMDLFSDEEEDSSTHLTPYENMEVTLRKCKNFVAQFHTEFQNLLFTGSTGVGKTFLTNCIAKELLDAGNSVIYFTATGLFDVFHNNAYNKSPEASDSYQNIFTCDLLIIDDLGTEVSNSYTNSQFFMCVNERILRQKSTIISTNMTFGDLSERYSERTFSRIIKNYEFIKLIGNDLRLIG